MSVTRLTGLTSGMDTDKLVKDLMKIEKSKIDNVDRDKIRLEWEQEAYREIIDGINAFQEEYFDLLKPESNFRSVSAFSDFNESVQVAGEDVSYVSVTGTALIKDFTHEIGSITQLATADEWTTDPVGIGALSSKSLNFGAMPSSLEFSLTIDGETKVIEISDTSGISDETDLAAALDTEIQNKFGADYAGIVTADNTDNTISFQMDGSEITILEASGFESTMAWLDFESGDSTTDYVNDTIANLFGINSTDLQSMTINGKSLTDLGVKDTSSLADLTKAISQSNDIDVEFSYNTISDTFTLQADDTGSANDVSMSTEFMNAFGFIDDAGHRNSGKNAMLELDGTSIIKSSNDFTLDGIQYSLNNTYDGASGDIEVKVETDSTMISDKIKSFVETYNGLVTSISSKLNEKREYSYNPLTTEEKEALSEDEIKNWEDKAKQGILKNDSTLENMLTSMRVALYESVDGVDLTLYDIGIETSSDYKSGGLLTIDEAKLNDALENNYESVVSLFTSESDKDYSDSDNSSERYRENGIGYRLFDIMQNNVRITRDSNGLKGSLLEKAGKVGDTSVSKNSLSELIEDYESRISNLWDDYYDKENAYYISFGRMEAALSEMQAQSSSLMSQLG